MSVTFEKLGSYGRFGNQLWQVASTIGIARANGHEYYFPKWEHSRLFPKVNIDTTRSNIPKHLIKEQSNGYSEIKLKNLDYNLEGYFQSYKYFEHCEAEIRELFKLERADIPDNSCSIHIRRGDYTQLSHIYPNLHINYYMSALEKLPRGIHCFLFSDDIDWVERSMLAEFEYEFFYNNFILVKLPEIKSFIEMYSCTYNIIANSSFSWWAAYLNQSPKKIVIAPSIWQYNEPIETIEDRLPKDWIRI